MASSPSKPNAHLVATYLAAAFSARASSSRQPHDNSLERLADEASNKVSDLADYFAVKAGGIKQFGMRRLGVAIKTNTSVHFTSEHALIPAALRPDSTANQLPDIASSHLGKQLDSSKSRMRKCPSLPQIA